MMVDSLKQKTSIQEILIQANLIPVPEQNGC
jgi:hypothetical protein